jgi:hypothetical protein
VIRRNTCDACNKGMDTGSPGVSTPVARSPSRESGGFVHRLPRATSMVNAPRPTNTSMPFGAAKVAARGPMASADQGFGFFLTAATLCELDSVAVRVERRQRPLPWLR